MCWPGSPAVAQREWAGSHVRFVGYWRPQSSRHAGTLAVPPAGCPSGPCIALPTPDSADLPPGQWWWPAAVERNSEHRVGKPHSMGGRENADDHQGRKSTRGTHLVGLGSPKVIIFRCSFCGHLPSDSWDVEQEIPKELHGAEPEKDAKRRVPQPQGAVSGYNQELGRKGTGRKCTQNVHGGYHGMGKVTQTIFISSHFPTYFLRKFSTSKHILL